MIEYEHRVLTFGRDLSRAHVRALVVEQAEHGQWELVRMRLYLGGIRRVWLRRKIIRVQRTA